MKEFAIYYIGIEEGKELNMVGSGYGENKEEALEDFLFWHNDVKKVTSVGSYK